MMNQQEKQLSNIAKSLAGIHKELKRLNDTNPANQAKTEQKQPNTKQMLPKNFL